MTSCNDFLEELPKTQLTQGQVFTDLNVLESSVDGLYVSFRNAKAGRAGFTFTLLGLDESKQGIVQMMDAGQSGLDYYDGMLNASSSQISEMWARRWPAINTAAKCIKGLEMMIETETDSAAIKHLKVLRANACFMRAMSMFEMTMYWGEVPVVDIKDLKQPEIDMSRRPLSEVWTQIISDFTYASQNLDEGKQKGPRATRGAAYAMLMKSYMYARPESGVRDFAKALKVFEDNLKGKYSLVFDFATLFDEMWPDSREFNLTESVFEVDFICNSSGPNYWQWDMGSRTLASRTEGEGCYIGGYDVVLPTEYAYKMKSTGGLWEDGDTRRLVSIRYDFTYQGTDYLELGENKADHPNAVVCSWGADELDPHIKKWEDRRLDKHEPAYNEITKTAYDEEVTSGSSMYWSGKNYIMIRYADLWLLYAECLNELDRTSEAVTAVNTLRQRRFKNAQGYAWSTSLSKDQFRNDILDERMRELCFEGWRRMDLIRTGKFKELISARNPWTAQKKSIQDFHMRWPVPEKELLTNPFMNPEKDQNPGY
jgi:hypothetical protein